MFLPGGYEFQEGGSGIFFKPDQPSSQVRILKATDPGKSAVAVGYRYWLKTDEGDRAVKSLTQPVNLPPNTKTNKRGEYDVSEIWVVTVLDRADNKVKIWELHQATIKKAINGFAQKTGDPTTYDLDITRTDGGKVSYQVAPTNIGPLTPVEQTMISGYVLDPHQAFVEDGKVVVNTQAESQAPGFYSQPAPVAAPAAPTPAQPALPVSPVPTVTLNPLVQQLSGLVAGAASLEYIQQLEEWAFSMLASWEQAFPGQGADMIAATIEKNTPAGLKAPVAPPAPVAVPVPVAPPVAAPPAQGSLPLAHPAVHASAGAPVAVAPAPVAGGVPQQSYDNIPF